MPRSKTTETPPAEPQTREAFRGSDPRTGSEIIFTHGYYMGEPTVAMFYGDQAAPMMVPADLLISVVGPVATGHASPDVDDRPTQPTGLHSGPTLALIHGSTVSPATDEEALVMACFLAVTDPTEGGSRGNALLADKIAARLDRATVRRCQGEVEDLLREYPPPAWS